MKIQRKPDWLRKKANPGDQLEMRTHLRELRLNTVCQQALCPNIAECFKCGQATFLILGKDCTRHCSFCNVEKASKPQPVDTEESLRISKAVVQLGLKHVVITSPTRDDLPDGGAAQYVSTVEAIRVVSPSTVVELLVPDFNGNESSLEMVMAASPAIVAHNIETVPRLYAVRSGADYRRSLSLLENVARKGAAIPSKSGIMLGLGETEKEVTEVMRDLRQVGCSYLSIGQYLAPSRRHHPVVEYIEPARFQAFKEYALSIGFRHVESAPYVRSSYHASDYSQDS